MAAGAGFYDVNNIYKYGETDSIALFSDFLNVGQTSISNVVGDLKTNTNTQNYIINGAFDIWQRGTTFSNPGNTAYNADRWRVTHDGTGATRTISQQTFTAGAAPVAGYEGAYFMRYAVTAAGSGNSYQDLNHTIEDVRTLAGKTVTLSFWAKSDSTRSLSLLVRREWNNYAGADQNSMGSALSITSTWQRYSITYTMPSLTGITVGTNSNLRLIFRFAPATTQTIDIWGVQLEAGTTATTFRRNSPNIQAELAACRRYYQQYDSLYITAFDVWKFGNLPEGGILRATPSVTVANIARPAGGASLGTNVAMSVANKNSVYTSSGGSVTTGTWISLDGVYVSAEV